MIGVAEWLYYNEAEGCDYIVQTHTAKMNAVVNDIRKRKPRNDDELDFILNSHNLTRGGLRECDWDRLREEIEGR